MELPLWSAAPFALLLFAIAAMPMLRGAWWHANRNKAIVVAALALPMAGYLCWEGEESRHALQHEVVNYVSFMAILGTLYTISGGVAVRGHLPARPLTNTLFLAGGALLANVIGTTGASMLLVRPLLRANGHRKRVGHLPVFFIFTVCNTGGLLTPLGDPPLFLGYLKGVEFTWTFQLWPQWLFVNAALLALFAATDFRAMRKDRADARLDPMHPVDLPIDPRDKPAVIGLWPNALLLAGVVGAVFGQKFLPQPVSELAMVALALASLRLTPAEARRLNRFDWEPIGEVAVLFAGLFVTMVPALLILDHRGKELGLTEAWHYFWATGLLSAILDNAPTYLTFGTVAAEGNGLPWLMANAPAKLAAVSCGAVFMGAGSYIGNGPNFMVRAIAQESGYRMPSFFLYMLVAAVVLGPILLAATALFFVR